MVDYNNFFDLNIVVNEVVGSIILTLIIGLAIVWWFSTKNNAAGGLAILASLLLIIIFSVTYSLTLFWILVLLFVGIVFYTVINHFINKM